MDAGLEMVETPLEILPGRWHKTNEAGAELQSGDHCHQPLNAGAGHWTLGGLNLNINTVLSKHYNWRLPSNAFRLDS